MSSTRLFLSSCEDVCCSTHHGRVQVKRLRMNANAAGQWGGYVGGGPLERQPAAQYGKGIWRAPEEIDRHKGD